MTASEGYREHKVISLVGAGGKTTLMYALAERCSRRGASVLVTTTTHIYKPKDHFAEREEDVRRLWAAGTYAVVGADAPGGKLSKLSDERLRALMAGADRVFLEADGAKGHPCKVPRQGEPVLLPESSLVIGVLGMSCIGQKMQACCFRMEEAAKKFRLTPDTVMTEEIAITILSSRSGTRKDVGSRRYAVVLNQCDTEEIRKKAERIAQGLKEKGIKDVALTHFGKK